MVIAWKGYLLSCPKCGEHKTTSAVRYIENLGRVCNPCGLAHKRKLSHLSAPTLSASAPTGRPSLGHEARLATDFQEGDGSCQAMDSPIATRYQRTYENYQTNVDTRGCYAYNQEKALCNLRYRGKRRKSANVSLNVNNTPQQMRPCPSAQMQKLVPRYQFKKPRTTTTRGDRLATGTADCFSPNSLCGLLNPCNLNDDSLQGRETALRPEPQPIPSFQELENSLGSSKQQNDLP